MMWVPVKFGIFLDKLGLLIISCSLKLEVSHSLAMEYILQGSHLVSCKEPAKRKQLG